MKPEKIKIVYIDDDVDPALTQCLRINFGEAMVVDGESIACSYDEIDYSEMSSYADLLNDHRLRSANIALIDSKLFDVRNAEEGMLTGEMLKAVLRRFFPFMETLIISSYRSSMDDNLGILRKYDLATCFGTDINEYYSRLLDEPIKKAAGVVLAMRHLSDELAGGIIDSVTAEKIENSIKGIELFDELKESDIDAAVRDFETIKRLVLDVNQ